MDEELTPQQAERVRRLLAEARHDDPAPQDVVARLDRVIADLGDERAATGHGTVSSLATRRRKAGRMLLVAAAVVVAGVSVGQIVGGAEQADDSTAGTAESTDDQVLEAPERGEVDGEESAPQGGPGAGAVVDSERRFSLLDPPAVLADRHFTRDARAARDAAATLSTQADRDTRNGADGATSEVGECAPGTWGGGRYVAVRYGPTPAWLVLRPPQGDTQVADLFLCGEDDPERSATLPYP